MCAAMFRKSGSVVMEEGNWVLNMAAQKHFHVTVYGVTHGGCEVLALL